MNEDGHPAARSWQPPPPPRPGSHSAAREEAILTAAAELVVEMGYERLTVDAIAARARASKSTMYRKWPGKAELVADALRRRAGQRASETSDTVNDTGTDEGTGTVRGDLRATVAGIARTLTGDPATGPSLLSLVEAIRADPLLRDVIRRQIDERSAHEGALICERARARGEDVDAGQGAVIVGLALAHLFLRTLLGGEPPDDAEQQRLVDETLQPLLTPRPAGHPDPRRPSR